MIKLSNINKSFDGKLILSNFSFNIRKLDKKNKEIVISLLHELKNCGKTVICVTHDQDIARESDRIIEIP